MAIWTDLPHTAALLNAADNWKRNCLLRDGSIFTDQSLWTLENLQQLHSLFVDNPILGKQKFYDKLHMQIDGANSDVKKLASEALWVLFLIVSETVLGVETKRERIAGVWNLSGEELPSSQNLDDNVLRGLANPGIAFLTKVWMEFGFLLTVFVRWKSTPASDRDRLLKDSRLSLLPAKAADSTHCRISIGAGPYTFGHVSATAGPAQPPARTRLSI
jgi:5-methylcytosine-specific restriction protein B